MSVNLPTGVGVTDDDNRTLNLLLAQLAAKRPANQALTARYEAKHALRYHSSVIPPHYYNIGMVLGWIGSACDILGQRCNLTEFVWPDGDLASIGGDVVWEDNYLASEVDQGILSSLIHGTAFVVNSAGDPSVDEPAALIQFKDALNATGTWNTRSRRLDAFLSVHTWNSERREEPDSFTLYVNGRAITAARVLGRWTVTNVSQHRYGVPAEPLPYRPRLGKPFGATRISRAARSMHDAALRASIRLEAHSDIYAIPDLWLFGASEALFTNPDGTPRNKWDVLMGRIKGIPDDEDAPTADKQRAEAKQFPASDPDAHLKTIKQQAQLFAGETKIPLSSLGVSDMTNPTSSDSYTASREDLVAEAENATDAWSPFLRRAFRRSLAMRNGLTEVPPKWASIDTHWRSPLYTSKAAQADAGAKQIGALPWLAETSVALELLGMDAQQAKRAWAEKNRAEGRDLLTRLAERRGQRG